jgi:hypothetical protein
MHFQAKNTFCSRFRDVFRRKQPVLQVFKQEKAGSDLEFDREFAGTSTGNTPGINREIDREL